MKIYVISDPKNIERVENIKTQFASQEDHWEYEIIEAVMNPAQPSVGILRSFKKCIELAKKAWYPQVMIIEDDFDCLSPTSIQDMINTWNKYALNDGILLGGLYEADIIVGISEDISGKLPPYRWTDGKIAGLQSVIIPENLYDLILQTPEGYHLDYFLSMGHTIGFFPYKLPIYCMYPLNVLQKSYPSANGNDMAELNRTLGLKYKLINNLKNQK